MKKTGTVVAIQKAIENNQPIIILDGHILETLILQLKTDDGKIYTFDICEWGLPTLRSFSLALEDEARVKIKNSDFNYNLKGRIGRIKTSEIEILENSDNK